MELQAYLHLEPILVYGCLPSKGPVVFNHQGVHGNKDHLKGADGRSVIEKLTYRVQPAPPITPSMLPILNEWQWRIIGKLVQMLLRQAFITVAVIADTAVHMTVNVPV